MNTRSDGTNPDDNSRPAESWGAAALRNVTVATRLKQSAQGHKTDLEADIPGEDVEPWNLDVTPQIGAS